MNQFAVMIEEHERSRGEMFKLDLLQSCWQPGPVDGETLFRGRQRLLSEGEV